MNKRMQIILNPEAWALVEVASREANDGFDAGSINYSDVINEMILCSKIDVRTLQLKHSDLRRSLRAMASKEDIDLEAVLKNLSELKSALGGKKRALLASKEAI